MNKLSSPCLLHSDSSRVNPSHEPQPWLFNGLWQPCSVSPFSWKGKRNPFSSHITVFHIFLKTSKIAVLLHQWGTKWIEQPLRRESTYKIKSLTCTLNQEKELTLCPTSIWDAVISTASLPLAHCQFVEAAAMSAQFAPNVKLALPPACSGSFCVPSSFKRHCKAVYLTYPCPSKFPVPPWS